MFSIIQLLASQFKIRYLKHYSWKMIGKWIVSEAIFLIVASVGFILNSKINDYQGIQNGMFFIMYSGIFIYISLLNVLLYLKLKYDYVIYFSASIVSLMVIYLDLKMIFVDSLIYFLLLPIIRFFFRKLKD